MSTNIQKSLIANAAPEQARQAAIRLFWMLVLMESFSGEGIKVGASP